MGPVEPGSLRGGVGGGGERAPRGGGGGRPQPFPPGSPGTERAGGCGRPPPRRAARDRRGAAALPLPPLPSPFPGACRVGAPAPRPPAAAPPRFPPHAALAPLRKGPGASPRGRGPSAGQRALRGGGRAGRGAGLRAGIPLGSGTSCTAQGAGGAARGRAPRCSYCALARPPPPSPHPPQKNAAAAAEPIGVCITSCLLLFLPGPRAHPPAWGEGGDGRTGAQCALFGWKRPNARMGGSAGGAQRSLSPGGLRGKNRCPPAAAAEGRGWGGLAAEHRRPPG